MLAGFSNQKMAQDLLGVLQQTFPQNEFVLDGNSIGIKAHEVLCLPIKNFVLGYTLGMQKGMSVMLHEPSTN
jgi:hypothetical protein